MKDKIRNFIIKKISFDLGNIEELENEINIYVLQKSVDKINNGKKSNKKFCHSPLIYDTVFKSFLKKIFKITKPINYIVENINFQERLVINTEVFSVVFSNCNFKSFVSIDKVKAVTFKSNEYNEFLTKKYKGELNYLLITNAQTVVIEDEVIMKSIKEVKSNIKPLHICAKEVTIINSQLGSVYISAQKFELFSAKILGDIIKISTPNISLDSSRVIGLEEVSLNTETPKELFLDSVNSPQILINTDEYKEIKKNTVQKDTESYKEYILPTDNFNKVKQRKLK